ncbi:hypothetical protein WG66_012931 [Moniliophthora roreri]|nr:hypothetical protein WG66_012931 [Moniliophthora roreri]
MVPVILPTPGHFVVVQLDAVESVAHLDNPELTEACQNLKNKKYLALVGDRDGLFWPDVPYYGYSFSFVHEGLKYEDENQQPIDPGMCAPVLPNTSHPLGRAPLDPGQPLPWNDCYISTNFSIFARCHTVELLQCACISVLTTRNRSEQLAPPEQQVSPTPTKAFHADSQDDEGSDGGVYESWNPTHEMERAMKLEEILEEIEEIDAELMELVVFRTSFDITELKQVTDPAELIEELEAFETLKDELVLGQRRRKIEDARKIDEGYFTKLNQSGNDTPSTSTSSSPSPTPSPTPSAVPKVPDSLRARGARLLKTVGRMMKRIVKLFHSLHGVTPRGKESSSFRSEPRTDLQDSSAPISTLALEPFDKPCHVSTPLLPQRLTSTNQSTMEITSARDVAISGSATLSVVHRDQYNQMTVNNRTVHVRRPGRTVLKRARKRRDSDPEYDQYREVIRGDIHKLEQLSAVDVWDSWERKDGQLVGTCHSYRRMIHQVRVYGDDRVFTSFSYHGRDAEKIWKEEFMKYSPANDPAVLLQLFAINRSKVPALLFHDGV